MIGLEDRRVVAQDILTAHCAGARLRLACETAGIDVRTLQRWKAGEGLVQGDGRPAAVRPVPAHALSPAERARVLSVANEPRFADMPPARIVPMLADEGVYVASESSFARVLRAHGQAKHRGRAKAPKAGRPLTTHIATAPRQVWCWDMTYLPATVIGQWFHLYLILDLYSRKIVGWEVHDNQDARRHILAVLSTGTMAMATTVKDSNLFGSIPRAISLGKELADPESDESAIIKAVGKELGMLMPATIKKVEQSNDPRVRSPATWAQSIQTGLGIRQNVGDSRTSFAYDPLGEVRTLADIGTIFSPVSSTSTIARERGYSEDHSAAMLYFDKAAQVAGTTFSPIGVKNPQQTGQLDLRTMMTEDGTQTMYDKVNENYRGLNPAAAIRAVSDAPISDGTYKYCVFQRSWTPISG